MFLAEKLSQLKTSFWWFVFSVGCKIETGDRICNLLQWAKKRSFFAFCCFFATVVRSAVRKRAKKKNGICPQARFPATKAGHTGLFGRVFCMLQSAWLDLLLLLFALRRRHQHHCFDRPTWAKKLGQRLQWIVSIEVNCFYFFTFSCACLFYRQASPVSKHTPAEA